MAHLLIVDDGSQNAAALAPLLQGEGHQATCAADPSEALHHLAGAKPDLVLIGLSLIGPAGMRLLDALSGGSCGPHARVAFYCGRPEPEPNGPADPKDAPAGARMLGACGFVSQGMDWPQTYRRIQAHLPAAAAQARRMDGRPWRDARDGREDRDIREGRESRPAPMPA